LGQYNDLPRISEHQRTESNESLTPAFKVKEKSSKNSKQKQRESA